MPLHGARWHAGTHVAPPSWSVRRSASLPSSDACASPLRTLSYSRDLFELINARGRLDEKTARGIFRQVAAAVSFLHDNNLVHGDVKDENVLVDSDGAARLIDFGSACFAHRRRRFDMFTGTLDYAAPEVLRERDYAPAPAEAWTLGVLLFLMVVGRVPFDSCEAAGGDELQVPSFVTLACRRLIRGLLRKDPLLRVKAGDIQRHTWMTIRDV